MIYVQDVLYYAHEHFTPAHLSTFYTYTSTFRTFLVTALDRLATNPDIPTILAGIVILIVSLKVLDLIRRAVIFWVSLVLRLIFWAALIVMGLRLYTRGVAGVAQDAQGAAHFWMEQYHFWQQQAELAQTVAQQEQHGQAYPQARGYPANGGRPGRQWW